MTESSSLIDHRTSAGAYFARGIVVTLMVYGHISFVGTGTLAQEKLYEILHSFRMPVLIFLTGYFLNLHRAGPDTLRRAVRMVLIPYAIFETLYLAVHTGMNFSGLMHTNTPPITSVAEFFLTLLVHPTGPFWFLYYLALMQIAVAMAQIVQNRWPSVSIELFLVAIGCGLAWVGILSTDFVLFYLIGIAFRARRVPLHGSIAFAMAIVLLGLLMGAASIQASYLLRSPFVLGMVVLLVSVGAQFWQKQAVRIFVLIGQNSISILCWHAFLIAALRPFARFFLMLDPTGLIYALAATAFGVAGALVLTWGSDRIGTSRLLFGGQPAYRPLRQSQGEIA